MTSITANRLTADEHSYFLAAAAVVAAVVIGGFAFEYDQLAHPAQFSALVQAHGLVMFGWIGLFLTQVVLAARRRLAWHRQMGRVGAVLALLVVVLGVPTSIIACRLGGDHLPPGATPPGFLADALSDLAQFALLAGSGLALRRHPDLHKRLMLLANLPPLNAAIVRLVNYLHLGIGASTFRDALLLAFIVVDIGRTRRLHPAFLIGGGGLVLTDFAASALAGTAAWVHVVRALTA
ncbi:MAG TPA: hypothetical protein VJ738_09810 [Steroidobacteraceae bacterium]|nr:hypothetical protein [Steroidobacteraceae bacterium]